MFTQLTIVTFLGIRRETSLSRLLVHIVTNHREEVVLDKRSLTSQFLLDGLKILTLHKHKL